MQLVKRFMLKDIRQYEQDNNVNLIDYFKDAFDIYNLIELIKIGNHVETLEACALLDKYLENTDNGLVGAYTEIRDTLLGKPVEQESDDDLDTSRFNSLTELFNELCKQAMSIGLTYSEFWSMDTKEMYQVVEGIQQRKIEQYNEDLSKMHTLAAMIGAAAWGKLDKNPPQIEDGSKVVYTEEFGEITLEEYRTLQAIGAIK